MLIVSNLYISFLLFIAYILPTEAFYLPSECNKTQIFNPITFKCDNCNDPVLMPNSEKTDCTCANGYVKTLSNNKSNRLIQQCLHCSNYGLVANYENEFCVRCPVNSNNSDHKCLDCTEEEIIIYDYNEIEHSKRSEEKEKINRTPIQRCISCPAGKISNKKKNTCVDCPNTDCFCEKMGNNATYCSTRKTRTSNADSILLNDGVDVKHITLEYLGDKTVLVAMKCRNGDRQACQYLSNLCVLSDFNRNVTGNACYYLEDIKNTQYIGENIIPNLFYSNTDASTELNRENAINGIFRFNASSENYSTQSNQQINIISFAYSMNGSFLGMIPFEDNTINMCFKNQHTNGFKLGRIYRAICEMSIEQIIQWNNGLLSQKYGINVYQVEESTIFYELFLQYYDINNERKFYQIPIINENIRDNSMNFINRGIDDIRRSSKTLMVRRFFVVDRKYIGKTEQKQEVVRIPEFVSIVIQFQSTQDSKILPPYLQIRHRHCLYDYENTWQNQPILMEFSVKYSMVSFRYEKFIELTMGSLCSLSLLFGLVKAYSWTRRAGRLIIDTTTIAKFILYAFENIANVFFIVITIVTVWITYAYKSQEDVILFPLNYEQETTFIIYIITAVILNTIVLLHNYITLVMVETFFIDWERPRFALEYCHDTIQCSIADGSTTQTKPPRKNNSVVIWRTYLVANEWNELQCYRKTNITIQLFSLLFLLEFLHFGDWAIIEPGFKRYDEQTNFIETRMSRFAIDASFYAMIGFAQWFIQVVIKEKITDPFRNFMDLCSITNISVLTMTHSLHGYYIHGRSVHGLADTDMLEMNTFLQREKDNLCGMRGLENGSEIQTFRVNMPRIFRERLNQLTEALQRSLSTNIRQRGIDKTTIRIESTAIAHNELSQFLKNIIDHADTSCDYTITDSKFIEEVLGIELSDTSKIGTFTRDYSETGYSAAFLYGNEWTQLLFEMLLFCVSDMFFQSRIFSCILTGFISILLRKIVQFFFTINLVKSSLVDNRFLF